MDVRGAATFLPQYRSPLLPDGLPWGPENGNCGPTSIVNVLRAIGLDVPGFSGERSQRVIDAARMLATGSNDPTRATLKSQQARALRAAGATVRTTPNIDHALDQARVGVALLLGGNRAAIGWPRRPDDPPPAGLAAHAIVVSDYLAATDQYVVLDPALAAPALVGASQLRAFTEADRDGRMPRLALLVTRPA